MTLVVHYDAKKTAEIVKEAHAMRSAMVREFFSALYGRIRRAFSGSTAVRAH